MIQLVQVFDLDYNLLYASYNQTLSDKNLIRCYSWYDIFAKIIKQDNN